MNKSAQVLPPTRQDLMRYMVEDSALANAHVTNPLTHMGVGAAVGTPLGALIGALVAANRGDKAGKGAILGAIVGGLSGFGAGTISGGIKGSVDIIKNKKRRARHALDFVVAHGVDHMNGMPPYDQTGEKQAEDRSIVRRVALLKSAGLVGDYAAAAPALLAGHLPVVGPAISAANGLGGLAGMMVDPAEKENKDTNALSVIPGVGMYLLGQRVRRVADASDDAGAHGSANLVAELAGPVTSGVISGGAGGYAGYRMSDKIRDILKRHGHDFSPQQVRTGATAAGITAGIAIPAIVAMMVAGIRRKRTKGEQVQADTLGRSVAKYVVPGLAKYDSYKRLGASTHYDKKPRSKKK